MTRDLSESQILALADADAKVEGFAHPRTVHSLIGRGLMRPSGRLTPAGHAVLAQAKERWPGLFRYGTPN